jgi:23S rRNA (adenine2503-C2)-methyltransferase
MPLPLCSFSYIGLIDWLKKEGIPTYRAAQIYDWIYHHDISSFEEMTNLSKNLRQQFALQLHFPVIRLIQKKESQEVEKFLWELVDGHRIESVLIHSFGRKTVCLSSQVGCPGRCVFCASGRKGLTRSLSCAEIVEQLLHIDRMLRTKGERASHVVFMGMGEPLENYEEVVQAIRIIHDEKAFAISQRRITVSTVGVVEGINRLAKEDSNDSTENNSLCA